MVQYYICLNIKVCVAQYQTDTIWANLNLKLKYLSFLNDIFNFDKKELISNP